MDRPRHKHQLGVNKIGKNIKKSPLNKPNLSNGIVPSRPQSRESLPEPLIRSQYLPKLQQNILLKTTKPPALTQINRPHVPPPIRRQPTHDLAVRPTMHPLPHCSQPMMGNGDKYWSDTTESLDTVCMRYLQSSPGDSGYYGNHIQPSQEYQIQPQVQGQAYSHPLPQPHSHHSHSSASSMPILPTPRFNGPPQQIYSNSPRFNGRGILSSPTSQHILRSSTTNRNLLSPRSPYPLSPGLQYLPPLTARSFTSSSMAQPGILGPGAIPQPPASRGLVFPISGPRWSGY